MLAPDNAKKFQELNVGLVPPDETTRAVIRALPRGEPWRRSQQSNVRMPNPSPTPIGLEGEAARWPTDFARHESVPDAWSSESRWFFWIVITDKQLHAFEGDWERESALKEALTAGPEAAHYPLDRIDEIWFDQNPTISQLSIWFKDGSSIELDAGRQEFGPLREAIKPFERADSPRAKAVPRGWMPNPFRWTLGLALLIGGLALLAGAGEPAHDARLLAHKGETAQATVENARTDARDRVLLDVTYRDEIGFSGEAAIERCGDVDQVGVGDTIAITYDPDDLARAQATACENPTSSNPILLAIGLISLALGAYWLCKAWAFVGWRWRRIGIPLAFVGVLFAGTAFSEDCYCIEFVYFGAALILIGVIAQFSPGRTIAPPPP